MRIGKYSILFALIVSVIAAYCMRLSARADESVQEIESRRDHFRIVGEVEFDGERIAYDEVIQVRVDVRTISVMGLKKGDNRVLMSRLWVSRLLKGGGALLMEVPSAAGLFTDLERGPDPKMTPSHIRDHERPPEVFLPEFYWIDRPTKPSVVEVYFSESYFAEQKARLRIIRPFRIEFVPATPSAESLALEQMASEPKIDLDNQYGLAWNGMLGFEIPFAEFGQLPPALAAQLEHYRSRRATTLPEPITHQLWDYARQTLRFGFGHRTHGYGTPQPVRYPDGHGILYRQWDGTSSDAALPIECDIDTQVCRLREDIRGFTFLYRTNFPGSAWRLRIGEQVLPIVFGQSLVDNSGGRILLIGYTSF